jgi:hypothetical protein
MEVLLHTPCACPMDLIGEPRGADPVAQHSALATMGSWTKYGCVGAQEPAGQVGIPAERRNENVTGRGSRLLRKISREVCLRTDQIPILLDVRLMRPTDFAVESVEGRTKGALV